MYTSKPNRKFLDSLGGGRLASVLLSALLGVAVFLYLYGFRILNPSFDDWLYTGGDLTQHYLGWIGYRNSRWFFPIGLTDQLAYPLQTSIIFTDSIPLLAVFFKLLSPLLPSKFQYFGLYGLITFVLNGSMAALLLRKWLKSTWMIVLSSGFFILSLPVLQRMYTHTALASHWLILFALYLLASFQEQSARAKCSWWCLVSFLAISIHTYLLPICGVILVGACVADLLARRWQPGWHKWLDQGSYWLGFILTAAVTTYMLGGFTVATYALQTGGLGIYSMNLNALFNPQSHDYLLPAFPTYKNGQYEGFVYLGLGAIILLLTTVATLVIVKILAHKQVLKFSLLKPLSIGLMVTFLLAFLFALSPAITYGNQLLLQLSLPSWIIYCWSIFRSTGRMGWVCLYILLLFAICADYRAVSPRFKAVMIMIGLVLQIADIHTRLSNLHKHWLTQLRQQDQLPLNRSIWDMTINQNHIRHLVIINHWNPGNQSCIWYPVAIYGLHHQLSLNQFYFARSSVDTQTALQQTLQILPTNTVFIWFLGKEYQQDRQQQQWPAQLNYCRAGDYLLGVRGVVPESCIYHPDQLSEAETTSQSN